MTDKRELLIEERIVDIVDEVREIDDDPTKDSPLSQLNESEREAVQQALAAQQLSSRLIDVAPPEDLPMKTARRARRRRRQLTQPASKTWLDQLLDAAILVLVLAILSLFLHHLSDHRIRQQVERIETHP